MQFVKNCNFLEENCNDFHFLEIFAPLEAKMMKNQKKNEKMKKTRGKLQFFIFLENCNFPRVFFSFPFHFFIIFFFIFYHFSSFFIIFHQFHHWKQKFLKHDKQNEKNSRKIVIFHFLQNFCTTGSKNDET